MPKQKTHFEQVPVKLAKRIAELELSDLEVPDRKENGIARIGPDTSSQKNLPSQSLLRGDHRTEMRSQDASRHETANHATVSASRGGK